MARDMTPSSWLGRGSRGAGRICIRTKNPPHRVRNDARILKEFQTMLQTQGVEIALPALTAR